MRFAIHPQIRTPAPIIGLFSDVAAADLGVASLQYALAIATLPTLLTAHLLFRAAKPQFAIPTMTNRPNKRSDRIDIGGRQRRAAFRRHNGV